MEDIIVKYIDGTATSDEKQQLLNWLQESEEHVKSYHEIANVLALTSVVPESELDDEFRKLKAKADQPKAPSTRLSIYRMVASMVAVTLFCFIGYWIISDGQIGGDEVLHYDQFATADMQKNSIMLSDGTLVVLNENSTLSYPSQFAEDERVVKLVGEGYFDVAKDSNRPFKIKSEGLHITVLGTKFDLRSAATSRRSSATLIEGKIQVTDGSGSEYILNPNEQIIFNKETLESEVKQVEDANSFILWTNNQLTFEHESLKEILYQLQFWYGIKINIPADLPDDIYLSLIVRNETEAELFSYLKLLAPIDYNLTNQQIDVRYLTK